MTWPLQDAAAALEGVDFKLNTTVASLDLAGKSVALVAWKIPCEYSPVPALSQLNLSTLPIVGG